MNQSNELDIITQIRAKVTGKRVSTGKNLFLVWGYPTALIHLVEFAALMFWGKNWCAWLWIGIPLVGAPLMIHFMNEDYERTMRRTLNENIALQLWLFIGFACCVGGFTTGFTGIYEQCYCTLEGILVSLGCFLTGVISRFRPMQVCGIIGVLISFACLFFQGEQWPWQLLLATLVTIIALIIPGHLLKNHK
jgi:hypothetical protein